MRSAIRKIPVVDRNREKRVVMTIKANTANRNMTPTLSVLKFQTKKEKDDGNNS
jgi:hypothetical protein